MTPLNKNQTIEVRSPNSKAYYIFYRHPDTSLENILLRQRVSPVTKRSEKSGEWIIEKDLDSQLSSLRSLGFTEIKIIEDNAKMDKESSKKTR